MKAATIHRYGSPDVLTLEQVPRPVIGSRDVLIQVHATSINPVDWKIRSGNQRAIIHYKLPWILGMDVSGVVVEVGSQVKQFRPGDEVYSSPTHKRLGTYAQYVAIDEHAVAHKPKNLTHEEAASLPLVGLTAWEALVTRGRLQSGQQVLIQAGSGGVGSFAIQLAKHLGASVISTCSSRNVQLVRDLGADQVIDYTQQNFWDVLRNIDLVVDVLGGKDLLRSRQVVRRGGRISMVTASLPKHTQRWGVPLGFLVTVWEILSFVLWSRLRYGISVSLIVRPPSGAILREITNLVEAGAIRPLVDRVFPLEEIVAAHEYSESGRVRGKIVVSVSPESSGS